jgi:hypothetical protein
MTLIRFAAMSSLISYAITRLNSKFVEPFHMISDLVKLGQK